MNYNLTDRQANIIKDVIRYIKIDTEKDVARKNNTNLSDIREELDAIFIALGNGRVTLVDNESFDEDENFDLEMETKYGSDSDEIVDDMITGSD